MRRLLLAPALLAVLVVAMPAHPGQVRFELVVDDGGTPNDPSDDTELSAELVKGSTGRTDDFCGAVVPALT